MIKVLKKNNQVVEWDFSKIVKASNKAAKRVTKQLTEDQKSELEVLIKDYTNRSCVWLPRLLKIWWWLS